jgi:hypothetical protein
MSFAKSVPEGLKLLECERGIGGKNPLIRYIPEKDPVQEALEKNKKTNYFKLMLPHMGSELKVTLWASGTPEQFKLHVRATIHACKQIEHDVKFSKAKEAVVNAILNLEITKDEYVQVCSSEKKVKREHRRKPTRCIRVPSGCKVGLQKSHTGCRCHKACHYDRRSKGLQTLWKSAIQ